MRRLFPFLFLFACGSDPANGSPSPQPSTDGGAGGDGGTPGTTVTCPKDVSAGPACSEEGACCSAVVASESPAEGFRCSGGKWTSDSACLPPPAACKSALTGSLKRVDGTALAVTCLEPLGRNKVIGAVLKLDSGQLQIAFDTAPKDGDVITLRSFNGTPTGTSAGFQIGTPGGFAGFTTQAESVSGSITITKVVVEGDDLTTFAATLDAEVVAKDAQPAQWNGKLTGSWQ